MASTCSTLAGTWGIKKGISQGVPGPITQVRLRLKSQLLYKDPTIRWNNIRMCKESLVPSSFPHSLNLRKDLLNISSHFVRLDDQRGFESQGKNMSVCHLSPDQPIVLSSRKISLSWILRQLELKGPPRNFLLQLPLFWRGWIKGQK